MNPEDNFKFDKTGWLSKDVWLTKKWSKLTLKVNQCLPERWGIGSHSKMAFDCLCGNSISLEFKRLYSGLQKSCGHCNDKSKEYWLSQKWGKIKLSKNQELPNFFSPSTSKKFLFDCECGNTEKIDFKIITYGQKSCGHCNDKSKEYWLSQKWGDLVLDPKQNLPYRWNSFTPKKFNFICMCNKKLLIQFSSVYNGNSKSCGHCNDKSKEYWLSQKWGTLSLCKDQILSDHWGENVNTKFTFVCDCGNNIGTRWADVTRIKGGCKSCGCKSVGRTLSSPAGEIFNFVKNISADAIFGYKLDKSGKEYDIYVPSRHLAIEYQGLIWHSEKFNSDVKRDYQKYKLSIERNDTLLQVFADEWIQKQNIIKDAIIDKLHPKKRKRVKPKFVINSGKTPSASRKFLDEHHYLGAAGGCITVNAIYDEKIIGCWIFMKRTEKEVVWHRACVHPDFRMWNPHQRALDLAIPILSNMGFEKIVSFSDNRFHTGSLYLKLGFDLVKELKSDYGYTNGIKRYSKYNFRVPSGINEKDSAIQRGYYRIWDSGKKKFLKGIPLVAEKEILK